MFREYRIWVHSKELISSYQVKVILDFECILGRIDKSKLLLPKMVDLRCIRWWQRRVKYSLYELQGWDWKWDRRKRSSTFAFSQKKIFFIEVNYCLQLFWKERHFSCWFEHTIAEWNWLCWSPELCILGDNGLLRQEWWLAYEEVEMDCW